MAFCSECGKELATGGQSCASCGKKVDDAAHDGVKKDDSKSSAKWDLVQANLAAKKMSSAKLLSGVLIAVVALCVVDVILSNFYGFAYIPAILVLNETDYTDYIISAVALLGIMYARRRISVGAVEGGLLGDEKILVKGYALPYVDRVNTQETDYPMLVKTEQAFHLIHKGAVIDTRRLEDLESAHLVETKFAFGIKKQASTLQLKMKNGETLNLYLANATRAGRGVWLG